MIRTTAVTYKLQCGASCDQMQ